MNLLTTKQVSESRRKEESAWAAKIDALRRSCAVLQEKIRLAKLDLPEEKEREVAAFQQFQRDMQKQKEVILLEHQEWREKIRSLEDVVDGIQAREDALNEKSHLLDERRRRLDDRERVILSAERRLAQLENVC